MKTSSLRRISMFLAMIIVLTLLPATSISVKAASCKTFNTLDEIEENLQVFKTISTGDISAEKINGSWYYKFSRKGADTIFIKASAFSQEPKNNYLTKDNQALTKAAIENEDRICYFNRLNKKTSLDYDKYTVDMYRFLLEVEGYTSDQIVVKCELLNFVSFTYCSKVPSYVVEYGRQIGSAKYVAPSCASEYKAALTRSSAVSPITPELELTVSNTGDNNCCFSSYTLCGLGNASTSNINELISVASATNKTIKAASTIKKNPISCLVSLISLIGNTETLLNKNSKQYNTGKTTALTKKGGNPVLKVHYISPITFENTGDWLQITTYLHGSQFSSKENGVNAAFDIQFSFS